jgi:hypothetical protein
MFLASLEATSAMSRVRESPVSFCCFVRLALHAERSMEERPNDGYRRIMSTHVMRRKALYDGRFQLHRASTTEVL